MSDDEKLPPCGNRKCGASTGICGRFTFGRGYLDNHGYWSIPCSVCARDYEKTRTNEEAWPPAETKDET